MCLVLESCFETCAVLKCKELCCILLICICIYIFIHILGNDNVLWYDGMLTFHMHRQSLHSVTCDPDTLGVMVHVVMYIQTPQ